MFDSEASKEANGYIFISKNQKLFTQKRQEKLPIELCISLASPRHKLTKR